MTGVVFPFASVLMDVLDPRGAWLWVCGITTGVGFPSSPVLIEVADAGRFVLPSV